MYICNLHVGTEYTHIVDLGSLVENTIPSDKKHNCVHKSLQIVSTINNIRRCLHDEQHRQSG